MQTAPTLMQQIIDVIAKLSPKEQARVLRFAQRIGQGQAIEAQGIPAQDFLQFFREHPVTPEEAKRMRELMNDPI